MNSTGTSLGLEIEHCKRLLDDLRAIRDRQDARRLNDLVTARRHLADHLMRLGTLSEEALPATDQERRRELRELRAAARTALALHQTQWPAVKLKNVDAGPNYRASALRVDAAITALLTFVGAMAQR